MNPMLILCVIRYKVRSMSSEEFKIYISSNSVNPTRVLRVSRTMMNSGIVVVSIGFVLVVSCLFDYVGLKIQKPQYNHVRTEHQYLLSNLQFVESELGSLEKQVESVEQLHFSPGTPFFLRGKVTYRF